MQSPKKRHTVFAALTLALGALPAATAVSPALATTATLPCQSFSGPTPSVEIDTNNDGNPEVRVPSLSNVSVCGQGTVIAEADTARVEPCSSIPMSCWRLLIEAEAGATLSSDLRVCRAIDGAYSCSTVEQPPWTVRVPEHDTLCVGIDLNGGFPCGGGTAMVAFQ